MITQRSVAFHLVLWHVELLFAAVGAEDTAAQATVSPTAKSDVQKIALKTIGTQWTL